MKAKKGAKIDMFKKEIQKLNAFASDLRIEIDNLRMEIGKNNNKKNNKNDTKTDKDCKCKYKNNSSKINHFNNDFLYKKDDDETNDMTHKNRKVNEDIENKKPFHVKTLDDNKESKIEHNKNNNRFVVKKTKNDNKSTITDDEYSETCANSSSLVTEKNDVKNLSTPISIYIVSVKLKNDDKSVYLINFSIQQDSVKKHIHATKKFPIFVKRDIKEELVVTIYKKGTIYNTFVKKFGTIDFVGTFVIDNIKIKVTKDETVYFPEYFKTRIISRNNYLKALLSVELSNLSFFQRMLQYLNFMNTRWLLPDAKVYVKDLRTGEIIEEKTSRMVKYYLTFFYTKRLAESRFYRHLIKKMTIKIGMKMNNPKSTNLIKSFVDYFKINMKEVKKPMCDFTSFNDFFCRELNSDARKIENSKLVSSPADCRIIAYKTIDEAQGVWIKGNRFSVESLLDQKIKCKSIFICRLAPQDYHRFHSPVNGKITSIYDINGDYLTVHPVSVGKTNVLTENKRIVVEIESSFGKCFVVCVGAALVGSITISVKKHKNVKMLDELGYFEYGGSTVIVLFTKCIGINQQIGQNSLTGIETLVKVGDSISS